MLEKMYELETSSIVRLNYFACLITPEFLFFFTQDHCVYRKLTEVYFTQGTKENNY